MSRRSSRRSSLQPDDDLCECLERPRNGTHQDFCPLSLPTPLICCSCGSQTKITESCPVCNSIFYCSDICAQIDRRNHDIRCQMTTRRVMELASRLRNSSGKSKPRLHALDLLQLHRNECRANGNIPSVLKLLVFDADVRHFLRTMASHPKPNLEFYMVHDRYYEAARTILILTILKPLDDKNHVRVHCDVAKAVTQIMHSSVLDDDVYQMVCDNLERLLQPETKDLLRKPSTWLTVSPPEDIEKLASVWKTWFQLTRDPDVATKINLTRKSRVSSLAYVEAFQSYMQKIPMKYRESAQSWVLYSDLRSEQQEKTFPNVCLATISSSESSDRSNLSLDPTSTYLPFRSWDFAEVATSADENDVNLQSMYSKHLIKSIANARDAMQGESVRVKVITSSDLDNILRPLTFTPFDRIMTGGLADRCGTPEIVRRLGLLLNTKNPHSCVVTHHSSWSEIDQNSSTDLCSLSESDKRSRLSHYIRAEVMRNQKDSEVSAFVDIAPRLGDLHMRDFCRFENKVVPFSFHIVGREPTLPDLLLSVEWIRKKRVDSSRRDFLTYSAQPHIRQRSRSLDSKDTLLDLESQKHYKLAFQKKKEKFDTPNNTPTIPRRNSHRQIQRSLKFENTLSKWVSRSTCTSPSGSICNTPSPEIQLSPMNDILRLTEEINKFSFGGNPDKVANTNGTPESSTSKHILEVTGYQKNSDAPARGTNPLVWSSSSKEQESSSKFQFLNTGFKQKEAAPYITPFGVKPPKRSDIPFQQGCSKYSQGNNSHNHNSLSIHEEVQVKRQALIDDCKPFKTPFYVKPPTVGIYENSQPNNSSPAHAHGINNNHPPSTSNQNLQTSPPVQEQEQIVRTRTYETSEQIQSLNEEHTLPKSPPACLSVITKPNRSKFSYQVEFAAQDSTSNETHNKDEQSRYSQSNYFTCQPKQETFPNNHEHIISPSSSTLRNNFKIANKEEEPVVIKRERRPEEATPFINVAEAENPEYLSLEHEVLTRRKMSSDNAKIFIAPNYIKPPDVRADQSSNQTNSQITLTSGRNTSQQLHSMNQHINFPSLQMRSPAEEPIVRKHHFPDRTSVQNDHTFQQASSIKKDRCVENQREDSVQNLSSTVLGQQSLSFTETSTIAPTFPKQHNVSKVKQSKNVEIQSGTDRKQEQTPESRRFITHQIVNVKGETRTKWSHNSQEMTPSLTRSDIRLSQKNYNRSPQPFKSLQTDNQFEENLYSDAHLENFLSRANTSVKTQNVHRRSVELPNRLQGTNMLNESVISKSQSQLSGAKPFIPSPDEIHSDQEDGKPRHRRQYSVQLHQTEYHGHGSSREPSENRNTPTTANSLAGEQGGRNPVHRTQSDLTQIPQCTDTSRVKLLANKFSGN